MEGKKWKKGAVAALTCGMLLTTGAAVFAATASTTGTAGSTGIVAETGFSGTRAYAKVSTTANVYATMNASASYRGGTEIVRFSGSIEEKSYGEISTNCGGTVYLVDCEYYVLSADDKVWTHYMYAH